jgi:hypothetical protein
VPSGAAVDALLAAGGDEDERWEAQPTKSINILEQWTWAPPASRLHCSNCTENILGGTFAVEAFRGSRLSLLHMAVRQHACAWVRMPIDLHATDVIVQHHHLMAQKFAACMHYEQAQKHTCNTWSTLFISCLC